MNRLEASGARVRRRLGQIGRRSDGGAERRRDALRRDRAGGDDAGTARAPAEERDGAVVRRDWLVDAALRDGSPERVRGKDAQRRQRTSDEYGRPPRGRSFASNGYELAA